MIEIHTYSIVMEVWHLKVTHNISGLVKLLKKRAGMSGSGISNRPMVCIHNL